MNLGFISDFSQFRLSNTGNSTFTSASCTSYTLGENLQIRSSMNVEDLCKGVVSRFLRLCLYQTSRAAQVEYDNGGAIEIWT